MKFAWPTPKKKQEQQAQAETRADQLKEELAKRREELLRAALELSKGSNDGG